jgi:hypothetical protein
MRTEIHETGGVGIVPQPKQPEIDSTHALTGKAISNRCAQVAVQHRVTLAENCSDFCGVFHGNGVESIGGSLGTAD